MERYKEISLAEMLDLISKGEFSSIYVKSNRVGICHIGDSTYNLSLLKDKQWFKREVIE
ncbi:hypothetical protein [Sporosarcina sp. FSL K6-5500]|uniref:hypothetical protein n=1 Tax=Sporosarcina sp. FSL K6-5500 TaxID=2921558 RepID=UPI0030F98846